MGTSSYLHIPPKPNRNIGRGCRADFYAYYTCMLPERQDYPIAKMIVQCNQDSTFRYSALKYFKIIGTHLANLRCPDNIISFGS